MDNAPYDIVHLMEPVFIKLAGRHYDVCILSQCVEKIFKGEDL